MFTKKYVTKKRNEYKFKKAHMNEIQLPYTNPKYRRKTRNVLRKVLHIKSKLCGLTYEFVGKNHKAPDKTVIYAVTHIGKFDYEMLEEAYDAFFYPVAGDWELTYGEIDDYFLRLNGVLYVDTGDKEDRGKTYDAMVRILQEEISILIFPEGIWNLTSNLPVMKLFSGAVKAAKQCNVSIIPIGMEQIEKHFYINIGEALNVSELEEKQAVEQLRDALATLRWQIWEKLPRETRADIPENYYEEFFKLRLSEWAPCSKELIEGRMFRDKIDRELAEIAADLKRLRVTAK